MLGLSFKQNISLPDDALKERARDFVLPFVVFLVVVTLSLTFGRGLVLHILSTSEAIAQSKQQNEALQVKKDKLAALDTSLLTQQAQVSVQAVPSESSSLVALSAIRIQAFEKNVQITEIKIAEGDAAKKLGKDVDLQFELNGSLGDIITLFDSLGKTAPILRITKMKMTGGESGKLVTDVSIKTLWALPPKTIPPVNAPLETLSKKDQLLLQELGNLRSLALKNVVPASASARENPFVQ